MSEVLTCVECGDRTCTLKTSRKSKQLPEVCPWSNTVDRVVYAHWQTHVGPADIPKKKTEE